ncbi:acyltransferase [Viscerimonas tarda]
MIERNVTIDYFKLFLCVLVMTIHMSPLFTADKANLGGWLISNGISRIAVPCFFLLNGYFIQGKLNNRQGIYSYLKRMLKIYIVWTLIFIPFFLGRSHTQIALFVVFGYYHLWYLPALMLAVFGLFVLKKAIKSDKTLLILIVVIYFIGYIIQYYLIDSDIPRAIKLVISRNGLFNALPFVFLGYYIKAYEDKLKRIKNIHLYITTVLCFVLMGIESYISYYYASMKILDAFAVSLIICPALFLIVLKHSKFAVDDGYIGQLASGIYFVHVIAISLVVKIFNEGGEFNIHCLALIYFFSMLLSAGVIAVNKRLKIFI